MDYLKKISESAKDKQLSKQKKKDLFKFDPSLPSYFDNLPNSIGYEIALRVCDSGENLKHLSSLRRVNKFWNNTIEQELLWKTIACIIGEEEVEKGFPNNIKTWQQYVREELNSNSFIFWVADALGGEISNRGKTLYIPDKRVYNMIPTQKVFTKGRHVCFFSVDLYPTTSPNFLIGVAAKYQIDKLSEGEPVERHNVWLNVQNHNLGPYVGRPKDTYCMNSSGSKVHKDDIRHYCQGYKEGALIGVWLDLEEKKLFWSTNEIRYEDAYNKPHFLHPSGYSFTVSIPTGGTLSIFKTCTFSGDEKKQSELLLKTWEKYKN